MTQYFRGIPRDIDEATPGVGEKVPGLRPATRVADADRDESRDREDRCGDRERGGRAEHRDERPRQRGADDARDDVAVAVDRVRPFPQRTRNDEGEQRPDAGIAEWLRE